MSNIKLTLLTDDRLERSCVVSNCRMNRERALSGSNGYARELRLNPVDLLMAKAKTKGRWLDLCCGSGRALIEAATLVQEHGLEDRIDITGVDLVPPPFPPDPRLKCLRMVVASLAHWQPNSRFDVITCVHGLHYLGDKLGLIGRAASWLEDDGQFVSSLDLNNFRLADGRPASRVVARELRRSGLEYDGRRKLLRCVGRRSLQFPFRYLGADDQAGPNYTKQPAVNSYYDRLDSPGAEARSGR